MTEAKAGGGGGGGVRRLGDFVLLDEVGRGGMGVVFRARQESLGRVVAVKVLPSFAGLDREAVARFRREAETAARISHPGIVPVYDVGEEQGTYYFAMELVSGPPLESVIEELQGRNPGRMLGTLAEETSLGERCPAFAHMHWPAAPLGARYAVSCAAIAVDLANALCVAHNANVIHRDLKPSNVLLAAAGRPMIVDFGLSRDQTAVGLTQSGDAVGTPSYMSPEQAYGVKDLDARVDVYGLGATLYEMLTLRPPFDGAHAADIMRQIIEDEPVPVRALNARVPRELAVIVHKCLAKDRDARYPTMEAVELDLRAFLQGRATQAQAPSLLHRGVHFCVRHRRGIGVATATTVTLSLGGMVVGVLNGTRMHEEGLAQLDRARAALVQHANLEAAQESYGRANQLLADSELVESARLEHAQSAFEAWYGQADRRPWLGRLLNTVPEPRRTARWHALHRRLDGEAVCKLEGYLIDGSTTIALSRFDGQRFTPVAGGWPGDGVLAAGHYVVRLERPGLASTSLAFTVERDTTPRVQVPQLSVAALHESDVLVASADPPRLFALGRTELSGREFTALIAGLSPAQKAEFATVEVDGERNPVRNLSARQARALAALAGGHLPSVAEFKLAGRADVPAAAMPYPWGADFAEQCVNADPVRSSHPDPVDSHGEGASPFGALNLVGNVAEITAAGADGVARLVGGDFLSRREQATLDASEAIVDFDQPQRRGGVRVARFLYTSTPASTAAAAAASARLEKLWGDGAVCLISDWSIGDKGDTSLRVRLAGFRPDGDLRIPLSTPGFLQVGDTRSKLGDTAVVTPRQVVAGGETSWLRVPVDTLAPRQLYRFDVETALLPLSGLLGRADGYVLQVPLKASGTIPVRYRVTLPPGCAVDEVDPPPSAQYVLKDRPVVLWEFGADGRGTRTFSGVVHFRKDGWLCTQWPTKDEALAVVNTLFAALKARDTAVLTRLLAPTFQLLPANATVAHLTDPDRDAHEWFDNVRFVDVTAVGSVFTADLLVDWYVRDGRAERTAKAWPLRVHWRRDGDRAQVLQVAPAGRGDSGRVDGGTYLHDDLLLRVEPAADYTLARTVGHLAPMQLELRPAQLQPCFVMVLGRFEDKDNDEAAIWQRLSDGCEVIGGDKRNLGRQACKFGAYPAEREDWLFAAGTGFTRERWLKVSSGRRRVLLRLIAVGVSESAAHAAFESAQPWFDTVLPHIRLE